MQKHLDAYNFINVLRDAFGFKMFLTWARPLICPFERLICHIPKNSKVFDVGCGNGSLLFLIAKYRDPKKLYGVDIFENDLKVVKVAFRNTHYKKIKTFEDWPDEKFDVVTAIDVLHHIEPKHQTQFILELLKKLSPKGTLIIKDMSTKPWICAKINIIHDLIFANQIINYFSFEDLIEIIRKNNFEIKEINSKILFWYSHEWVVSTRS